MFRQLLDRIHSWTAPTPVEVPPSPDEIAEIAKAINRCLDAAGHSTTQDPTPTVGRIIHYYEADPPVYTAPDGSTNIATFPKPAIITEVYDETTVDAVVLGQHPTLDGGPAFQRTRISRKNYPGQQVWWSWPPRGL